ncbi:hypothetical protein [Pleionea sp. CnH1-48]|uniref:hypothetical protein n=1 Tax=Pleionea sp. CnH1-48 TaxID=2954494 RepID=UPI002096B33E|nr:hypothetical protein [Pleionea sp. CnH1-48]MCO7223020.1 hypothetical protein [Pleionea sp. CnH1-48]
MKKYRPTIPFLSWMLAVDLEETRNIQNQEGSPAYGCDCDLCVEWKLLYKKIIPEKLLEAFCRVGIELQSPTDLYGSGLGSDMRTVRVTFHFIGKILSGLNGATHDDKFDYDGFPYEIIRKEPYFSLRVIPQKETFVSAPDYEAEGSSQVLCVDMRLCYPGKYLHDYRNS